MAITTCVMTTGYREGISGTVCGQPVDPQYHERGPWMCAACRAESERRLNAHRAVHPISPSYVPAVADVYLVMNATDLTQGQAVAAATAGAILTTTDVAIQLGIAQRTVQQHVANLHLGTRIGRDVLLSPADVDAIRARVGQVGRPRHTVPAIADEGGVPEGEDGKE